MSTELDKPQVDVLGEARELLAKATPGPWFWNVNMRSRCAHLESQARGSMLETVIDFTRWGIGGAAPRFRDGEDLMQRVDMLLRPVEGREHHLRWYATVHHPDAELIARTPVLLESLCNELEQQRSDADRLRAALEAIVNIAGNLSDATVENVNGVNDARSRASMVITARQIAQNALAKGEEK